MNFSEKTTYFFLYILDSSLSKKVERKGGRGNRKRKHFQSMITYRKPFTINLNHEKYSLKSHKEAHIGEHH